MVVITDITNMFWGVIIDAGKRYSQVVKQGFHVSMAALESTAKKPNENVQVMLQHDASEYLLCTLHGNRLQQPLDLNFATGEQVSFSLNGSGVVHLTGYLIPEDDDDYDEESFSESEEEDVPTLVDASGDSKKKLVAKRKAVASLQASKKAKLSDSIQDDEDSEDDEDEDSEEEEGFSDDFDDEFDDEDDEDIDEDSVTPEKKEKKTPAKLPKIGTPAPQKNKQNVKTTPQEVKSQQIANKTTKQEVKTPNNGKSPKQLTVTPKPGESAQTPATPTSATDGSAKKKKRRRTRRTRKNDSTVSTPGTTPKSEATPKKRVVAGGTIVEDLKVGHGPDAKPGKMASVYYVGTLAKSNKRFDSCTEGKPFRFRLNQGEVIKGWDNGVLGMKVGGKRRITVPANQGYGNVKQGPIPPNSTLVFEVELKAVS